MDIDDGIYMLMFIFELEFKIGYFLLIFFVDVLFKLFVVENYGWKFEVK